MVWKDWCFLRNAILPGETPSNTLPSTLLDEMCDIYSVNFDDRSPIIRPILADGIFCSGPVINTEAQAKDGKFDLDDVAGIVVTPFSGRRVDALTGHWERYKAEVINSAVKTVRTKVEQAFGALHTRFGMLGTRGHGVNIADATLHLYPLVFRLCASIHNLEQEYQSFMKSSVHDEAMKAEFRANWACHPLIRWELDESELPRITVTTTRMQEEDKDFVEVATGWERTSELFQQIDEASSSFDRQENEQRVPSQPSSSPITEIQLDLDRRYEGTEKPKRQKKHVQPLKDLKKAEKVGKKEAKSSDKPSKRPKKQGQRAQLLPDIVDQPVERAVQGGHLPKHTFAKRDSEVTELIAVAKKLKRPLTRHQYCELNE